MIPSVAHLLEHPLILVLALLVAITGVGRLSRVITYDKFPPSMWVRDRWSIITKDGSWSLLAQCFWCLTPWLMLICIGWGLLSGFAWHWWLFWGWLGLSYVASMVVARDEP